MTYKRQSRRGILSGLMGGALSLAGCQGITGNPEDESSPSQTGTDPFRYTKVSGPNLSVGLIENHSVSKLTLINPDGTEFGSRTVSSDERKASIQILAIEPGGSDYVHYSPGLHELIAETETGRKTIPVPLEPDVHIVGAHQYSEGETSATLGKIAVTVENRGTGPTWVHQVAFQDAPNHSANTEPSDQVGVPSIYSPDISNRLIVRANESKDFVGVHNPIQFERSTSSACTGTSYQFTVVVGLGTGSHLRSGIEVRVDGEKSSVNLTGDYVCSDVSVSVRSEGD